MEDYPFTKMKHGTKVIIKRIGEGDAWKLDEDGIIGKELVVGEGGNLFLSNPEEKVPFANSIGLYLYRCEYEIIES